MEEQFLNEVQTIKKLRLYADMILKQFKIQKLKNINHIVRVLSFQVLTILQKQ